jgi:5-methylcytosine-specific restriction protein A
MAWSDTARKLKLPRDWPSRRRAVLARDASRCQLRLPGCTVNATEVDHLRCIAEGGDHQPANLIAVCRACHLIKTKEESARGRARQPRARRPPEPHPGLQ